MKRLRRFGFGLVIGVGVLFAIPTSRNVLLGYLRHEKTFRYLPTSYWTRELSNRVDGPDISRTLVKGGVDAVPVLMEAIDNKDPLIRLRSAETLGRIGKDAVPALLAAMGDDDPIVRITATKALNKMGPEAEAAVPALIAALQDDQFLVNELAIASLGKIGIGAKKAIPALIVMMQEARNPLICTCAIDSLGHIDPANEDVILAFTKAMENKEFDQRDYVARVFKQMAPRAAARAGVD